MRPGLFHQCCWKVEYLWAKMEHPLSLTPYAKINSKRIMGLYGNPEAIKLLDKNCRRQTLGSRHVHKLTAKTQSIKRESAKLDFIQIKNLVFEKYGTKRVKRRATDSEKRLANHISHKGLVLRIYKELSNSAVKKSHSPNRRWVMSYTSARGDIQKADKYLERCSTSLAHQKNSDKNNKALTLHTY